MTISVSDTLVPGGSGFGIVKAADQVGGYADAADEATIGALASAKLVLNATWRKSIASGTTYLLTSLTPGGGFANGTWTPVSTATSSGSWTPGALTVTTSNDTLSGLAARNGYTPSAGDRILVVAQTSAAANGIYAAASGAWSRTSDANTAGAFVLGKSIDITSGSGIGSIYVLTTAPTVLGTDPINFVVNSVGATVNWGSPGALGSTTPNTVKATSVDGTGTTDDFAGSGTTLNLPSLETVLASNSTHPVLSSNEGLQTTNATPTTIATYTPPANSYGDTVVTVIGGDFTGGFATGDFWRGDFFYTSSRSGGAAPVINPTSPPAQSIRTVTTTGGGSPTAAVSVSANTIIVQATGVAARTWRWSAIPQIQRVT